MLKISTFFPFTSYCIIVLHIGITKETILCTDISIGGIIFIYLFQLDVRWNMIACGKTRPTLEMTEQARHYLSSMQPRSLDL